jgi:hypothetical protein
MLNVTKIKSNRTNGLMYFFTSFILN